MHTFDDEYEGYAGKSRSQKKRESTAAQKTGETLAALSDADLRGLGLPGDLLQAVLDWKKFPGHEAKRRQMQYIGKLMRETDTDALREKLEALLEPGRDEKELLHRVEAFRDSLISLEDAALDRELERFATEHETAPTAKLRHLVVTARDERRKKRPPKAYRELFRLLKDILAQT